MNKSLLTNLLAACLVGVGILSGREPVLFTGMFALSGAMTNWLAIHMLFEKVPGLYGSGVIPSRFEDFKRGIHELIMDQFFTEENVERLLKGGAMGSPTVDPSAVEGAVDWDGVFDKITDAILESKFGGMLGMLGGAQALDGLREPVTHTLRGVVVDVVRSDDFNRALSAGFAESGLATGIVEKVDLIVRGRLEELTPDDVKRIVQKMIRRHLGWLVVWGGVLGGLIGLVTSAF